MQYKSQESAVATRTRIHGIKWPSTNPKLLCVEYLTPGDVERITEGEMVARGFAAVMWGVVLCLFEYEKDTLQPSLQNSMTYLYHDSNVWHSIWDLIVYNSNVLW